MEPFPESLLRQFPVLEDINQNKIEAISVLIHSLDPDSELLFDTVKALRCILSFEVNALNDLDLI